MKFFQLTLAAIAAAPVIALPFVALEGRGPKPGNTLATPLAGDSTLTRPHNHAHSKKHKHRHTRKSKPCATSTMSSAAFAGSTAAIESTTTTFPVLTPTTADAPFPTGTGFSVVPTAFSTSVLSIGFTSSDSALGTTIVAPSSLSTQTPSTAAHSATSVPAATPSAQPSTPGPNDVLRGVNVGNWLILEKFMDDGSVFTGKYSGAADQWSYDSLDTDGSGIQKHWASWFTESDVQKLASHGFNALRIPIGFWAFDNSNTPYHQGAADYLDQAIMWARNSGMKVLVDCHGSPGSQNGQEHSGHQGSVKWQDGDNLQWSTSILQKMIQRYGSKNDSDVVYGLEIVNEPTANAPNSFSTSQSWATEAYSALQQTISDNDLNPNLQIISHDSFMGPTKFVSLLSKVTSPVDTPTFGVDQHNYQLYTDTDNARDQPAHIEDACGWSSALSTTKQSMPVIVGEWSALTNICVKSDGSTYGSEHCDGSGNCATCPTNTWSPALVEQVRKYVEAQLDTFEAHSNGHFIWNFKSGSNSGWSAYDLIEAKAFPSPITDRQYPAQCS